MGVLQQGRNLSYWNCSVLWNRLQEAVQKPRKNENGKRVKCNQRTSIIKKTNVFAHKYIIEGTREGLEMGVVSGRAWSGNALGLPLSQGLALRRQLASAAGNKLGW